MKALLLDLDGTLLDHEAARDAAIAAWSATVLPYVPEGVPALWGELEARHVRRVSRGEVDFRTARRDRLAVLREHLRLAPLDDAGLDRCFDEIVQHYEAAWVPYPDVVAAFDEWAAAGVVVGMVTNGVHEQARRKLEVLGVAGHVRCLVAVDDLGFGKPDRRIFHAACERLGVAPGRTVYVGDDLALDAVGASEAGLTGVWLDRQDRPAPPEVDLVVRELSEVLPLLR